MASVITTTNSIFAKTKTNSMFANQQSTSILSDIIYGDLLSNKNDEDIVSTYLGLLKLHNAQKDSQKNSQKSSQQNLQSNAVVTAESVNSALRFFESPAKDNYAAAQFLKGVCWFEGFNGSDNRLRGLSLILATAENSDFAPALLYSAGVYARGDRGLNVAADPKQAFAMYRRAVEVTRTMLDKCDHDLCEFETWRGYQQLYKVALRNVGLCYMHGFGVQQDIGNGIRYLAAAAKTSNRNKEINNSNNVSVGDTLALRILRKLYSFSRLFKQRRAAELANNCDSSNSNIEGLNSLQASQASKLKQQPQPVVTNQFTQVVGQEPRFSAIAAVKEPIGNGGNVVSMVPALKVQRGLQRPNGLEVTRS